jgi:hypothetical protein
MDLFLAALLMAKPLKYVMTSNQWQAIIKLGNSITCVYKELTLLFLFHKLKINHKAHGSYTFILESGAVMNSILRGTVTGPDPDSQVSAKDFPPGSGST